MGTGRGPAALARRTEATPSAMPRRRASRRRSSWADVELLARCLIIVPPRYW